MYAQIFAEYGQSVVLRRFGVSSLGQPFCIFTRKRLLGGYVTEMITANPRNRPFISLPFKISGVQILEEAQLFVQSVLNTLNKLRKFSLGSQPTGWCIPVGKDMMQFDLLDEEVHKYPSKFLEIGDELFVECMLSGITFYHSGIYAGAGNVYHFMSNNQEIDSTIVSCLSTFARSPASVLCDAFYDFVHALVETNNGSGPRVFRVTHPFKCRSSDEIVEECERLAGEWDWYDIRNRNCQHFSSFCSTGTMISYDMENNLKYLACTLLRPSGRFLAQKIHNL
ncbi:unnamed protein product [Auanema sp. JU1783]|nr:unnamed protein product [Auanema sp. JU1783]